MAPAGEELAGAWVFDDKYRFVSLRFPVWKLHAYSKTRVAVHRSHVLKWLFPQEKATISVLNEGTFTLVLL
jgi:hypothetical protein